MSAKLKSIKFIFDEENIPVSLRSDGPGFCTYLECEISDGRTAYSHIFVVGGITEPGMRYGMQESYNTMRTLLERDGILCPEYVAHPESIGLAMKQHWEAQNAR